MDVPELPAADAEPGIATPEQFRAVVREWFRANVDPHAETSYTDAQRKRTTAAAYDAGILHVTWPVEYGDYRRSTRPSSMRNRRPTPGL
ncbi:hypothetical protein MBRA_50680 (plasmid) [Mycobacterium branderi]|uniref:Acyl-CoA dehydrogenase/oxidase N-terminal domain-containing protein n=1 Tax=Mycobacterium branderi TaxID=43348 RepID=A0ABM7KUR4_9MYCO|nr:hypothetical protein MBRA_50680 [Mycobacterium branderi]